MIDTGFNGFMLSATSLVMLMTLRLSIFLWWISTKRNILGIYDSKFLFLWVGTTVLWVFFWIFIMFSGGAAEL